MIFHGGTPLSLVYFMENPHLMTGGSIIQWSFQEPKLEVPTRYKAYFFQAYVSGNITTKFGQKYGTYVPPSAGS